MSFPQPVEVNLTHQPHASTHRRTRQVMSRALQRVGMLMLVLVTAIGGVSLAVAEPAAAAPSRSAIVNAAEAQLGGSACDPGYYNSCGIEWCAEFARWIWKRGGVTDVSGLDAWAQSFKRYGQNRGTYHARSSGYTPQPGDAIVFDWDRGPDDHPIDHVAIVVSVTSSTVNTIGGNQGPDSRVTRGSFPRSEIDIDGYVEPSGLDSGGRATADYDGDGYSDMALYRPDASNGSTWWANSYKKGGQILSDVNYGGAADIPFSGDFNGDGHADLALFRRDCTNGSTLWIKDQRNNTQLAPGVKVGGCKDIPVPADYDGDGKTDFGMYRRDCTNGSTWWAYSVAKDAQVLADHNYGGCNDIPVPGDYDGDGIGDLALFRPDCANGSTWWVKDVRHDQDIFGGLKWGGCNDIPVSGDFDGDRSADLGLYRQDCATGSSWWVYNSMDRKQTIGGLKIGGCADIPAPADYDGDKVTDLGLYRQDCTNGSSWSLYDSAENKLLLSGHKWGGCKDIPATSTKTA
ncbi:CHAP domain-containing protein [Micromonospora pisi]|uniref:CHAP domain-containing protein n=1 Tax=Micromonospora pisi TaxID=589240 RepID=A0A495JTM9_9ACTN|nr:CHAP domain-containing protein [Micromonospora pisi]RKR91905.1 CHAP domain-containing protein [Micromonospora pisi]